MARCLPHMARMGHGSPIKAASLAIALRSRVFAAAIGTVVSLERLVRSASTALPLARLRMHPPQTNRRWEV